MGLIIDAPRVRGTRLADRVAEGIASSLQAGDLNPGDPIPSEAAIASAYKVSKPIAREAVRQLSAMGLLQVSQGKVTRVRAIGSEPLDRFYQFAVAVTRDGLAEANEIRRMLEPQCVRLAALRRSDDASERLIAIVTKMRAALGNEDAFALADVDFHVAIAEATGNNLLRLQMQGLRSVIHGVSQTFTGRRGRTERDWEDTIAVHRAIAMAIVRGDADRAEAEMIAHFDRGDQAIRELYGEKRDDERASCERDGFEAGSASDGG